MSVFSFRSTHLVLHKESSICGISLCCCASANHRPALRGNAHKVSGSVQSERVSSRTPFRWRRGILLVAGWNLLLRSSVLCNGRVSYRIDFTLLLNVLYECFPPTVRAVTRLFRQMLRFSYGAAAYLVVSPVVGEVVF